MVLPWGVYREGEEALSDRSRLLAFVIVVLALALIIGTLAQPAAAISGEYAAYPVTEFDPSLTAGDDITQITITGINSISYNAVAEQNQVIGSLFAHVNIDGGSSNFTIYQGDTSYSGWIAASSSGTLLIDRSLSLSLNGTTWVHEWTEIAGVNYDDWRTVFFIGFSEADHTPGLGIESGVNTGGVFIEIPDIVDNPPYAVEFSSPDAEGMDLALNLVSNTYYHTQAGDREEDLDKDIGEYEIGVLTDLIDGIVGYPVMARTVQMVGMFFDLVYLIAHVLWFLFVEHFVITITTYEVITLAVAINKSRDIFQAIERFIEYNRKLGDFLIRMIQRIISIFTGIIQAIGSLLPFT